MDQHQYYGTFRYDASHFATVDVTRVFYHRLLAQKQRWPALTADIRTCWNSVVPQPSVECTHSVTIGTTTVTVSSTVVNVTVLAVTTVQSISIASTSQVSVSSTYTAVAHYATLTTDFETALCMWCHHERRQPAANHTSKWLQLTSLNPHRSISGQNIVAIGLERYCWGSWYAQLQQCDA